MRYILISLLAVLFFSCCSPVEEHESYSEPVEKEPVVKRKNPIDLERIYYYSDDEGDKEFYSYIEMFRFKMSGMTYIHVQEYNGDGYGYIINVTKDSLMCAQMLGGKPIPLPTVENNQSEHEKWYNGN